MKITRRNLLTGAAAAPLALAWANQTLAQGAAQVSDAGIAAVLAPPLIPPPVGAARPDVTIVEYLDFNCPVCRKTESELQRLLASDARLRLVYKNWPIFGAVSVYAAYCSFAAAELGQYTAVHRALMAATERLDSNATVDGVVRAAGVNLNQIGMVIDQHRQQFSAVLTRNQKEATALGLRGTPGLLVGNQLIAGGLQFQQLQELVARVRELNTQLRQPPGVALPAR